jgi:hypothetical protein
MRTFVVASAVPPGQSVWAVLAMSAWKSYDKNQGGELHSLVWVSSRQRKSRTKPTRGSASVTSLVRELNSANAMAIGVGRATR